MLLYFWLVEGYDIFNTKNCTIAPLINVGLLVCLDVQSPHCVTDAF